MSNIKNLGAIRSINTELRISFKIRDKIYYIVGIAYTTKGMKIEFVENIKFGNLYRYDTFSADTSTAWDLSKALKDIWFELEENPL